MSAYGRAVLCVLLGLTGWVVGQPPVHAQAQAFTKDEQSAIVAWAMTADQLKSLVIGQRIRALSVVAEESKAPDDGAGRRLAKIVFVNYGTGRAFGVLVDVVTQKVLDVQQMRGRPQSSAEERADARRLIERDPTVGPLLQQGAVLEGGFVVDPPGGALSTGRYLEFHVLSADKTTFQREVVVDLSTQAIAAVREYRRPRRH